MYFILREKLPANICLDEDVLMSYSSLASQEVFKMFIKTNIFPLLLHYQKMTSRRLDQDQYICLGLQDVFRMSCQDVLKTSTVNLFKTSSRRFQNVSKTSSRRLEDIFKMSWKDVFKTFLRLIKSNCSWWRNFKTSSKRIQTVSETYC